MRSNEQATFDDLGIPFPLFAAPVNQASHYVGTGRCVVCHLDDQHLFELGIGDDLIQSCPHCMVDNAFSVDDREDVACRNCTSLVLFPSIGDHPILVCYHCLRKGKAALTQSTELGMIRWEDANAGMTHGLPGLDPRNHPDFRLVATGETDEYGDDWFRVVVPQTDMWELVRTPCWSSWQDECWMFHCGHPMIFVGIWRQQDFILNSPDGDAKAFFKGVVNSPIEGMWEQLRDDRALGGPSFYAFRCSTCKSFLVTWDRT